jgi:type IX secretion system PorP/SprF family membrane protein
MRNILLTFSLLVFGWVAINAQDHAIYTQYFLNPVLINPGATGFNDQHEIFLNYRSQWSDVDGAPRNYTASYNGRLFDNVGLGVMASNETFGASNRFRGLLSYAYQIEAETYNIGFGITTEFHQFSLRTGYENDLLDPGDEIIADADDGAQYFDVNFGIYGDLQEKFVFGLSFPNLVRARVDESLSGNTDEESTSFRYFTLMTGYRFGLPDYGINLFPSIVLKRVFRGPEDIHADINILASFLDEQLQGGVTYQVGGSRRIGFILGTRLDNFNFHYSYDVSLNPLQEYSNGSHEITLGVNLKSTNSTE